MTKLREIRLFPNVHHYAFAAIFTFSYLEVETVLFLGQIFEMEILMELHVLSSPEFEKHIFSV